MRDLIRDYRMIINNIRTNISAKNLSQEDIRSDTETETDESRPLLSSGESLPKPQHNYRTNYSNSNPVVMSSHSGRDEDRSLEKTPSKSVIELVLPTEYDFRNQSFSDKTIIFNGESKRLTNSSIVTIFAIWNTTCGTSLLALPWGIEKTGLFPSVFINTALALLCLYTALVLFRLHRRHDYFSNNGGGDEIVNLCRILLGRWAEILAKIFSLVVLLGSNLVYWILMSNFLYNSVIFLYDSFTLEYQASNVSVSDIVLCPKNGTIQSSVEAHSPTLTVLETSGVWELYSTVPVFLALVMFPMLNWKSATFFTKFNSAGTVSLVYLMLFVLVKSINWGVNMDPNWFYEAIEIKISFSALTGMLTLSYFIHNIIVSIVRNNRNQENNERDISIAFALIAFTYIFIGVVFYVSFPLAKSCIEDNFLNNFDKSDTLTLIARILLMFQLFTVFPLITFMLRNDVMSGLNMVFGLKDYERFSFSRVVLLNLTVITICVLFACFLPRIGTLIRYTGALSGLVYIFLLPSLLQMASLRKTGELNAKTIVFYSVIIALGTSNLILQFFISD